MFENPGEKIVKIAKVLFWIDVIASVILAFVFGFEENYRYRYGLEFRPGYFFLLLIGGPFVSYMSALFTIAFGELVQNSQKDRNTNAKIKAEAKTK